MTRAEALAKVQKLMRLSGSSNAHEAAAALRQAQALMQSHVIDPAELEDDGTEAIGEVPQPNRGANPPIYTLALADAICAAFGLERYDATLRRTPKRRTVRVFVGPRSRAEVGVYAYGVLLRQLERDRRKHLSRVRVAKNRAARGDAFGMAWVVAVESTLQAFAGTDAERLKLKAHMRRHHPDLSTTEVGARTSKAVGHADYAQGHQAGRKAQLHRGVGGAPAGPAQLEHKS